VPLPVAGAECSWRLLSAVHVITPPLYSAACFRWVNCAELKSNVLGALERGDAVFMRSYPSAYAQWALNLSLSKGIQEPVPD
jgi:hypothetical protein